MPETAAIPLLSQPFYFVRHGESVSNLDKTVAGSLDVALTARGHEQAQATAAAIEHLGITAIYSSALSRARDTAGYISRVLALPVTIIPELGERNWGELEGQPLALRVRGLIPNGAETPDQFMRRVLRGLAKVDASDKPLIVSHSGVFRVLCRIFGIIESEAPVANAQPLRFVPPSLPNHPWRMEMP
jgi:probable phosphoglycerate mutase